MFDGDRMNNLVRMFLVGRPPSKVRIIGLPCPISNRCGMTAYKTSKILECRRRIADFEIARARGLFHTPSILNGDAAARIADQIVLSQLLGDARYARAINAKRASDLFVRKIQN